MLRRKKGYDGKASKVAKQSGLTLLESKGSTATFILSNAEVDRYGDSIDVKGWELTNYKSNPVVLFGHDASDVKNVVGKMVDIQNDGTNLIGTVEFVPEGINPNADIVRQLVEQGFLKTVSVGFKPLEAKASNDPKRKGGWNFTKQELLEVSIVPIPALPSALAKAADAGFGREQLEQAGIVESLPEAKFKDLWSIGWVASLLSDADWVHDMMDDDEAGKDKLLAGLQSMGQALCDMSAEALAELMEKGKPTEAGEEISMKGAGLNPVEFALDMLSLAKSDPQAAAAMATAAKHHVEGRVVKFAVAGEEAYITKAGRVLSADNEAALVSAKSALTDAVNKLENVLSQVAQATETEGQPAVADQTKTADDAESRKRKALALQKKFSAANSAN